MHVCMICCMHKKYLLINQIIDFLFPHQIHKLIAFKKTLVEIFHNSYCSQLPLATIVFLVVRIHACKKISFIIFLSFRGPSVSGAGSTLIHDMQTKGQLSTTYTIGLACAHARIQSLTKVEAVMDDQVATMTNAQVQDIVGRPFFKEPFNSGYKNNLKDYKKWPVWNEISISANIFEDFDNSLLEGVPKSR